MWWIAWRKRCTKHHETLIFILKSRYCCKCSLQYSGKEACYLPIAACTEDMFLTNDKTAWNKLENLSYLFLPEYCSGWRQIWWSAIITSFGAYVGPYVNVWSVYIKGGLPWYTMIYSQEAAQNFWFRIRQASVQLLSGFRCSAIVAVLALVALATAIGLWKFSMSKVKSHLDPFGSTGHCFFGSTGSFGFPEMGYP